MRYKFSFTNEPSTEVTETLCKGLEIHSLKTIGKTSFEPFCFLVHDSNEVLVAGCSGVFMYGFLHIKLLWVDQMARRQGLGRQLMEKAETFAKQNCCSYIMLETFNWQAKEFYEKLGYRVEFAYDGFDDGSEFYYFRKKL